MGRRLGDRAIAYNILIFFATLVVAALVYIVLDPAFGDVMNATNSTTDLSQAETGVGYVNAAWTWLPLFVAFLGMVQLVAAALFRSRRGGL